MILEEHVVTQEKWHRSCSWQMTLRLGLSEPPCAEHYNKTVKFQMSVMIVDLNNISSMSFSATLKIIRKTLLVTMGTQSNLKSTPRFSSQRATIQRSDLNWALNSALISNAKLNITQFDLDKHRPKSGPVTVQVHYRVFCSKTCAQGPRLRSIRTNESRKEELKEAGDRTKVQKEAPSFVSDLLISLFWLRT